MGYFLMAVILLVCVLLGGVILIQNPKGGGIGNRFSRREPAGWCAKNHGFFGESHVGPDRCPVCLVHCGRNLFR